MGANQSGHCHPTSAGKGYYRLRGSHARIVVGYPRVVYSEGVGVYPRS